MKKKWTSSEIKILTGSAGKQIPNIEGRSIESIRQKLMKLKIKCIPKNPNWTREEIGFLEKFSKENKGKLPEIEGRTSGAIRNKMTELGLRIPKKANEWTKKEIEILKNFSSKGLPVVPGKSPDAVRSKMKSMGLISSKHKNWTHQEIEKLKELFYAKEAIIIPGRTNKAIAKKMHELKLRKNTKVIWTKKEIKILKSTGTVAGRSKNSIRQMKVRLGIIKWKFSRKKWEKQNEKKLLELYNSGLSAKKIYELKTFPGQSKMAIQRKLCRMGLKRKKIPDQIILKLNKFLSENWQGKTPEELCSVWNIENHKYPVTAQRISKYLRRLNLKISSHEVQRINSLKKKEQEIISSKISNPNLMMEKIRAQRIKAMRARLEKNRDIWTGLDSLEKIDSDCEDEIKMVNA